MDVKKSKPTRTPHFTEKRIAESIERSHKLMQSAHERIQRTRVVKEKTREIIAASTLTKTCELTGKTVERAPPKKVHQTGLTNSLIIFLLPMSSFHLDTIFKDRKKFPVSFVFLVKRARADYAPSPLH